MGEVGVCKKKEWDEKIETVEIYEAARSVGRGGT